MSTESTAQDLELAKELLEARKKVTAEIRKVIIGQDEVIEDLLVALFSRGHCLFVGVPGLAKTLLVSSLAKILNLKFSRIQFTPDLMPSDITGTEILYEDQATKHREFRFIKGPIFSNIILADEINRTPPKTQAALLQAMQELQVTVGSETYPLDQPFLVFATQNPIEQEGTYPLPEAQLDRFMFIVNVAYPTKEQEVEIALSTTSGHKPELEAILNADRILELQQLVPRVPVAEHVAHYAVDLVQSSRPGNGATPGFVNEWVNWGAGPRASQYLVLAAKARALMDNRVAATVEDVKSVARQVLEHRIILNFKAEAENIKPTDIIEKLLSSVKAG
ncbi:MAG: AAA domain-containing protein [Nitrospinaceae bacterium]|nr:MoxR family ATPase [Nitrospinaceae bacterium]NIR55978.1 MoxR family ATPase [Nitrospinaceae bacterium]NIS86421.1 MoxR family ATPase [Nitrospinaceae bacterium]NIT83259.1 MoxR family ATPase [Nitrospinaceae bacterium]NIU45466.1 MoxR family ATPase [Nitrospinaceae bacterium]